MRMSLTSTSKSAPCPSSTVSASSPLGTIVDVEVGAEDRGEHLAHVVFVVGVEDFDPRVGHGVGRYQEFLASRHARHVLARARLRDACILHVSAARELARRRHAQSRAQACVVYMYVGTPSTAEHAAEHGVGGETLYLLDRGPSAVSNAPRR